jgi:hypothetical protein
MSCTNDNKSSTDANAHVFKSKSIINLLRIVLIECNVAKIFWELTKKDDRSENALLHLHQQSWTGEPMQDKICSKKRKRSDHLWP